MKIQVSGVWEPGGGEALTAALAKLGARSVWRAENGDVRLQWYRLGWRLVRVEWDVWMGLTLAGPGPVVSKLAEELQGSVALPHPPAGG